MKALEDLGEDEVEVITLLRGRSRRYEPAGNVVIKPGDILILQGEPAALERIVALEKLQLTREGKSHEIDMPSDEIGVTEAVITPDSPWSAARSGQLKLFDRYAVNLLAVSRRGRRITHRLRAAKLRAGDVVVLRGNLAAMPETLGELHCLPLAERDLNIGRKGVSSRSACWRPPWRWSPSTWCRWQSPFSAPPWCCCSPARYPCATPMTRSNGRSWSCSAR